jgi:hypothetical protein
MIRFVVGPDGDAVPDLTRQLPGRGMWVMAEREAVEKAVRAKAFSRAARRPVAAADGLTDRLETLLARRCGEILGLARRAGRVVAGFEKVQAFLRSGEAGCLVAAADAAADGKRKLRGLAGTLPVVEVLTVAELGLALGRENVVHAAVARGRLCRSFMAEADRLAGFRSSGRDAAGEVEKA